MAKKKSFKSNDQPELSLGNDDLPAANDQPSAPIAVPVDPTPEVTANRQKSEKVQDEQAPLAVSYRNWVSTAPVMSSSTAPSCTSTTV